LRGSFCHIEDVRWEVNRPELFVIEVPPSESGGWDGEFARSLANIGDDVPPFTLQLATLSLIKDLMLGVDAKCRRSNPLETAGRPFLANWAH
jgi:hypothetical protein